METLQRQLRECQAHNQLLANQQQVQTIQMEKTLSQIAQLQGGASAREVEERMLEEMERVTTKMDQIEEAVLRQIRQDDFLAAATTVPREEFEYTVEKIATQLRLEMDYVKPRLCKCKHKPVQPRKEEDAYGLRGKRLSVSRQKQQSSGRPSTHK